MNDKPKSSRLSEEETFWQVVIDKRLHRQFKARCAQAGKTMNEQVEKLIRAWLK